MYCKPGDTARWRCALACFALVLTGVSCSRSKPPAIQRLAILRFENLTGDGSLNWLGRAASEVANAELAGSRKVSLIPMSTLREMDRALGTRPPTAPGVSTEHPTALVSGATGILYGRVSRAAGKLRLDAAIYDAISQKIRQTFVAAGDPGDIIGIAGSLARQIDPSVRAYETGRVQALEQYCIGVDSRDPEAASLAFSRAADADPAFGAAYVAWAQAAAVQNKRAEAERILALAAARGNAIQELERARLEAIGAGLRGDSAGVLRALSTVGRLNPTDLGLLRQLGQANLNARRYSGAAADFSQALAIQPNDITLLNQLGYAHMYAGDLAEARKAIEEYTRLLPADPNTSDSLGDVNYYLGEFGEAEKYYRQSHDKDPKFSARMELLKAARARLMTGDIAGADAIFSQYLAEKRSDKDAAVELRQAEWEYLSGRRRQAIARLEAFTRTAPSSLPPGVVRQAYAQLAIWSLELGDRPRARGFAMQAAPTTASSLVARLLTEPPTGIPEWTARIQQALPGAGQERTRNLVLAAALLFARDFKAAAPLLEQAYRQSAPEPSEKLPVLLAWTLVENGRLHDAAPLLARNPIPGADADLFNSLTFPRLLFLRAEVLARQGRRQDAERNYRLFLTLSGPDADAFGYQARARQALGK